MIGKEVLGRAPVTLAEAGEILQSIEGERTYEQNATMEYIKRVAHTDAETAKKALERLKELGLDEELAVKIVNIWPKDRIDLYVVLAKESVSEDMYDKILEALKG